MNLQVLENVQADPVTVRVCDEAQPHVGRGIMKVTNQIHSTRTAFRTEHGVQFPSPEDLIGGRVRRGATERQKVDHSSTFRVESISSHRLT